MTPAAARPHPVLLHTGAGSYERPAQRHPEAGCQRGHIEQGIAESRCRHRAGDVRRIASHHDTVPDKPRWRVLSDQRRPQLDLSHRNHPEVGPRGYTNLTLDITLSDGGVRGERSPSRRYARNPGRHEQWSVSRRSAVMCLVGCPGSAEAPFMPVTITSLGCRCACQAEPHLRDACGPGLSQELDSSADLAYSRCSHAACSFGLSPSSVRQPDAAVNRQEAARIREGGRLVPDPHGMSGGTGRLAVVGFSAGSAGGVDDDLGDGAGVGDQG